MEDDIETLDSVLSDLTAQTEDAEARLAEANDKGERAVAAKTLQDIASNFDAGAAELEKAMGDVSKALAKMGAALPETLKVVDLPSDQSNRSDRDRILSIVLADGIASAIPFAMPHQAWRHGHGHGAALERSFHLDDRLTDYNPDGAITLLTQRQQRERSSPIACVAVPMRSLRELHQRTLLIER